MTYFFTTCTSDILSGKSKKTATVENVTVQLKNKKKKKKNPGEKSERLDALLF